MNKKVSLVLIFISAILLIGCNEFANLNDKNDGESGVVKKILAIDVESDFKNDSINVVLDDSLLTARRATTNITLNAAWLSGPHEYAEGNHKLIFKILNLNKNKSLDFTLTDTLTIKVNFNRTSGEILFLEHKGLIVRK